MYFFLLHCCCNCLLCFISDGSQFVIFELRDKKKTRYGRIYINSYKNEWQKSKWDFFSCRDFPKNFPIKLSWKKQQNWFKFIYQFPTDFFKFQNILKTFYCRKMSMSAHQKEMFAKSSIIRILLHEALKCFNKKS